MINYQSSMINKIQNAMLSFAPLREGRDSASQNRGVFSGQMQNPPASRKARIFPLCKRGRLKKLHYNMLHYNMLSWLPFGRGDGRRPKGFCSKKSPLPCKIAPLRGISQGESPFAKGGRIHSVIPAKTGIQ